jgi:pilus assembly protein CpaE
MRNVLRLAIVDPNDGNREKLKTMLLGMDVVWLEAECSRYEFFSDVVAQTEPEIGVVALDHDPTKALDLIRQLARSAPRCTVLVVSSTNEGDLILRAMRAGAKEFLTLPVSVEDLVAALERIGQHRSGGSVGQSRSCNVIAVAGASGGVGSTSLAVNLGCALAANELNSVALLDLDISLGDADVFLDTIPDYTLSDVAQNVARLDFTLLKRSLTKHSSGLYLLPRPVQLQETSLITPDDLNRVIGLLKATFSHLIIDISKSYSALDLVALEGATSILMITQLDLPCLRNVVRLMMSFAEISGLKEKTRIVVNRVGLDSGQISLKKAQETIGTEVFWQIPNDYRVMVEVRNNGVPLIEQAPKASITHSIMSLAAALTGDASTADPMGKSSLGRWLSFWPSKNQKNVEAIE